jgi:hypothetical protein
MVLSPGRFSGKPYEIHTGDVVMVAYLVATHPGEETYRVIRVGLSLVAEAIGFLMVADSGSGAHLRSLWFLLDQNMASPG